MWFLHLDPVHSLLYICIVLGNLEVKVFVSNSISNKPSWKYFGFNVVFLFIVETLQLST
jgi:hypothetical protein